MNNRGPSVGNALTSRERGGHKEAENKDLWDTETHTEECRREEEFSQ